MLNYLGPNIGPGPVASTLPPPVPGTMPSGIPGTAPVLPPRGVFHHAGAPHSALAAILRHAQVPGGGLPPPPPPPEYATETQDDGSILLRLKNPDGSPGSVVKVIPAIKRQKPHGA